MGTGLENRDCPRLPGAGGVGHAGGDGADLLVVLEQQPGRVPGAFEERLTGAGIDVPVTLPPAARDSFVEGTWDATGLLLDNYEEVEQVAARLPYLHWSGEPIKG